MVKADYALPVVDEVCSVLTLIYGITNNDMVCCAILSNILVFLNVT